MGRVKTRRNEFPPKAVSYGTPRIQGVLALLPIERVPTLSPMRRFTQGHCPRFTIERARLDDALNVGIGPYNLVEVKLRLNGSWSVINTTITQMR